MQKGKITRQKNITILEETSEDIANCFDQAEAELELEKVKIVQVIIQEAIVKNKYKLYDTIQHIILI